MSKEEKKQDSKNYKETIPKSTILSQDVINATGELKIKFTNDYMFRTIFQENTKALEGLLCSLLRLKHEQIQSIEITNPIELGKTISDKEYRLDLKIVLNNANKINIELQVVNEHNWENRSLLYLCREFDDLNKGEDYNDVKPAMHIGILDFTLFNDSPEFYAIHKLMNVKNHRVYNDRFILNVLDLTQIEKATHEDKDYELDKWAALFKSTTWEEIKMIAKENEALQEASNMLSQFSQDREVYYRALEREEFLATQRGNDKRMKAKDEEIAQKDKEIAQKDKEIANLNQTIKELQKKLEEQSTK